MNVCNRPECQSSAGCAHRGWLNGVQVMCHFPPTTVQVIGHGPCPYCLGSGKLARIAYEPNPFAGLPERLQNKTVQS